ncbi:HTH lysR-type domain-containing protein [Bordetella tumbae]|uniref:LysR family transcriptional regulator n=1 Tax=Bordetella tumbae TaxID=1649139 RepID=UPI0039EF30A1
MDRTGPSLDFDFNDIAVFVLVAKQRSISCTAELIGVSASTVSRRLSSLEEHLGVQLMSRSTRRILLTEAGKLYYEHCHKLIEQAHDAQDLLLEHTAQLRGTLKVLLPDTLDAIQLPAFIPQFARAWPDLQIHYDCHQDLQWEQHRDFDVALRWGTQSNSDLILRNIAQIEFGLYASEQYLKTRGMPKHPGELARHDCVYADLCKELASWTFHHSEQPLVVKPQSHLVLNDLDLAYRLACEGAGIVALPLTTTNSESLIPVLPTWRLAPVTLHAVYSGRTPPARVRVFIDELIQHASALKLNITRLGLCSVDLTHTGLQR